VLRTNLTNVREQRARDAVNTTWAPACVYSTSYRCTCSMAPFAEQEFACARRAHACSHTHRYMPWSYWHVLVLASRRHIGCPYATWSSLPAITTGTPSSNADMLVCRHACAWLFGIEPISCIGLGLAFALLIACNPWCLRVDLCTQGRNQYEQERARLHLQREAVAARDRRVSVRVCSHHGIRSDTNCTTTTSS
jgi:hypothetical protein